MPEESVLLLMLHLCVRNGRFTDRTPIDNPRNEQFKNNFAHKSAEIEATIRKLQEEIETVFKEGLFADEWIDTFTKTGNITSLDRSIVLSLVEKITIHEENRIEITFKYQDEYETLCRIIETLPVSLKEVGSNG